jgi:hypothetical protein
VPQPIVIEIVITVPSHGSQDYGADATLPEGAIDPANRIQENLSDEELAWLGRS